MAKLAKISLAAYCTEVSQLSCDAVKGASLMEMVESLNLAGGLGSYKKIPIHCHSVQICLGMSLLLRHVWSSFVLSGFLELINNMLTSGMVPALYADDEKEQIIGNVRVNVVSLGMQGLTLGDCKCYD